MKFSDKLTLLFILLVFNGAQGVDMGHCSDSAIDSSDYAHSHIQLKKDCSFEGVIKWNKATEMKLLMSLVEKEKWSSMPDVTTLDFRFGDCIMKMRIKKEGYTHKSSYNFPMKLISVNGEGEYNPLDDDYDDSGLVIELNPDGKVRLAVPGIPEREGLTLYCFGFTENDGIVSMPYAQVVDSEYTNVEFRPNQDYQLRDLQSTFPGITASTTKKGIFTEKIKFTQELTSDDGPGISSSTTESISSSTAESTPANSTQTVLLKEKCNCLLDWVKGASPLLVMGFLLCLDGAVLCIIIIDLIRYRNLFALVPQQHKMPKPIKERTPIEEKLTEATVDKSALTPSAQLSKFDEQVQTIRF